MKRLSKKERKRLLLEHRYPDRCFCIDRAYAEDKQVGEVVSEGHLVYGGKGDSYPLMLCGHCGKQYINAPAMA